MNRIFLVAGEGRKEESHMNRALSIFLSSLLFFSLGCSSGGAGGPAPAILNDSPARVANSVQVNTALGDNYLVGCGMYDITGPAAEVIFFGYVNMKQKAKGIHDRQWARAFIIVDPQTGERVVFVNCDLGAVFYPVVREVAKRLQGMYGNLYTDRNMVISATHTHCAPGGHSHHPLYNGSTKGYIDQNFEAIVEGK
ncbi:MAG: neutral/alkaline non-lysosomal ceramidase N-terminal domain-containing protein, partial [Planctomycetota bacterium]|nr:neutral/alkaline non-lysosomal ceramidase N-terminal domain-containing protein [Planctomycetota bacterium]